MFDRCYAVNANINLITFFFFTRIRVTLFSTQLQWCDM